MRRPLLLAVNAGSSSLKATLFDEGLVRVSGATVERVGARESLLSVVSGGGDGTHCAATTTSTTTTAAPDHAAALASILAALSPPPDRLAAVGHRVVHGGERTAPALWSEAVEADVRGAAALAPLHNPPALAAAAAARAALPAAVPHVAVFDTAFHVGGLPPSAHTYALPPALSAAGALGPGTPPARRFGFHGISCASAAAAAAAALGLPPASLAAVIAHLGAGASVTAVAGGASVDTSMGATPLDGLVMGTRCGALDPALPGLWLAAGAAPSPAALNEALGREAGLAGLSGLPGGDMRDVLAAAAAREPRALLAFGVWAHRARAALGSALAASTAAAGRLPHACVFTGGIGERCPAARAAVLAGLAPLGVGPLDAAANEACVAPPPGRVVRVDDPSASRVAILVIGADEERAIAASAWAASRRTPQG